MNKSLSEVMNIIKTKVSNCHRAVERWWLSVSTRRRSVVVTVALGVGMGGIYALSKGEEVAQSKVLTSRDAEFKKARILGNPYAASGQAKEQLLTKTAKEYADTQKKLLDGLSQINSRIDSIERKVTSTVDPNPGQQNTGVSDFGAGVLPSPSVVPSSASGGTSEQTSPVNQSEVIRNSDGLRPNIPLGIKSPEYPYSDFGHDEKRLKATKGPPVISFPVQGAVVRERSEVVLPVGSYVKAKLLTGVEAPEGNPYPVLMQLDFANILPNKKALDLRGCFMIAKAQGDLSTERVQMQATKLSCVSKTGQMFERDINGFVADAADNSFAVIGTVNTKQDRVAGMAFLSSVVEGVGRAIQMAQTSEQTSIEGTSKTTLTGDQGKYIAAGGAGTAAGMVAQWYLKQAQSLLPTINVGSGQDIWVVMNETVALPHEYFKKVSLGEGHGHDYSLVNRLFD